MKWLLHSREFDQALYGKEKIVWEAFELAVPKFLGKKGAENLTELISNLVRRYSCRGCDMSLKINF